MPKRTIILIPDDVGWDQYHDTLSPAINRGAGAGAQPYPALPNMLGLGASGLRFDRFYVTGSCSPTRVCLHTGRYPERTGVGAVITGDEENPLLESEVTLSKLLNTVGVKSALIGKDHMTNGRNGGLRGPGRMGFDYWAGTQHNINDGVVGGQPADASYYKFNKNVMGQLYQFGSGSSLAVRRREHYHTYMMTNDALRWIHEREDDGEDYLCVVAYQAPHSPFSAPPATMYDTGTWGSPPNTNQKVCKAAMEAMDQEVGRLLSNIDQTGLQVWLFCDNGSDNALLNPEIHPTKGPYNVGGFLGKRSGYEPGINVPAYVTGDGVVGTGRTTTELTHVVDLWRTIALRHGVNPEESGLWPEGRLNDSMDLTGLLQNTGGSGRETVFASLFSLASDRSNAPNQGTINGIRSIVSADYKLLYGSGTVQAPRNVQFFNLPGLDSANKFETSSGADLFQGTGSLGSPNLSLLTTPQRAAYDNLLSTLLALMASVDVKESADIIAEAGT